MKAKQLVSRAKASANAHAKGLLTSKHLRGGVKKLRSTKEGRKLIAGAVRMGRRFWGKGVVPAKTISGKTGYE